MIVLVDTGILLRMLEPTDPRHSAVRTGVRALRARGDSLVITAQNAAEFWNVCTRPASARGGYGLSVDDAYWRLCIIERLFPVIPEVSSAYQIWRDLLVAYGVMGVQVHDAGLVAIMLAHGITHILTLNGSDFTRYAGIVPISQGNLSPPSQASP